MSGAESAVTWLDEYRRTIADPASTFHDIVRVKSANLPIALFRYQAVNKYSLDAFARDYVWLSPPNKFNDLYDSASVVRVEIALASQRVERLRTMVRKDAGRMLTDEQIDAIAREGAPVEALLEAIMPDDRSGMSQALIGALRTTTDEVSKAATKVCADRCRRSLLVGCFSEIGDSPTMWAHYADQNGGFCLEFAPADLAEDDMRARLLLPVLYGDDAPFDGSATFKAGRKGPNNQTVMWPLLATTHKDQTWAPEREWRLVKPDGYYFGPEAAGEAMPMPTPRRLYLGARITPEGASMLFTIAQAN